jgi:hypothetical protein
MTVRIPRPIPEPELSKLIAAGKESCRLALDRRYTSAHKSAQSTVHKIIADIQFKYGIDDQS